MSGGKRLHWIADFETTTTEDDCRVWGWGAVDLANCDYDDDVEIGGDIDSFIDFIKEKHRVCYFHNLKFDGVFIIDWLFRAGYTHSTQRQLRPGEFSTLISNMGQYYSITVQWADGEPRTEFRDSLKKLPFSVKEIAKAFGLPMAKGEIDYHTPRPVGHVVTREEAHYIRLDVLIVARALAVQLSQGMTKLTVGSDSLADFKKIVGSKMFEKCFPVLSPEIDHEIRKSYKGGFTYADPRFSGSITGAGVTYDVNSLYPSVMYDRVLPYGEPVFHQGAPYNKIGYPLWVTEITFTAKLRKDHVPCIQIKGNNRFMGTEYLTVINEPVTLSVTSVDLALWQDHYELDIHAYHGTWFFKGAKGLFSGYINKWMKVKIESTGAMRALAKLHLNSLYGKFATNPDVTAKIPVFENNMVKLRLGDPETREPVYTAMGSFITAYARDVTIRAAQDHYGVFAYADTDSLHLLIPDGENPDTLDIDPHALGKWKREYRFLKAIFVRAKTYIELREPKIPEGEPFHEVHIAGMSPTISSRLTLENFNSGETYAGNLKAKTVPGGIVLTDVGFTAPTW